MAPAHINLKEMSALYCVASMGAVTHPTVLHGSRVLVDIDNAPIVRLLWLQVECDFSLSLRWVCSAVISEIDGIT